MMDIDAGKAALPVDDSRGDVRLRRGPKAYLAGRYLAAPRVGFLAGGGLL
jgi:hypothetical protein